MCFSILNFAARKKRQVLMLSPNSARYGIIKLITSEFIRKLNQNRNSRCLDPCCITDLHFRLLQQFNKLFLRSAYGKIRACDVDTIMEQALPGFSSFMLTQCPTGKAEAVTEIFPTEELFGVVTEGVVLDFSACCGLLDLSVEVKRQADERKRLYESFADPHPNIIFGELKNRWFSQLVYQRISAANYHVTFVSSARFIEVRIPS